MYLPMLSDSELVRYVENKPDATECEKRLAALLEEQYNEMQDEIAQIKQREHIAETDAQLWRRNAEYAESQVARLQAEVKDLQNQLDELSERNEQ